MSEQKPEKKVASRTVAIALGIIAIILVVGLVGAMINYNLTINGKDNTITTTTNQKNHLETLLNGNTTLLNQTQTWLNENKTLLGQTQISLNGADSTLSQTQKWLSGNKTLLSQTQNWLQGNITYYNSQITSLEKRLSENETDLQAQINQLQTWLSGNITAYNNYVNDHSYTNEQYQSLQTQITNLQNRITQLETWLSGNETTLGAQINQLKTWLSGNETYYQKQISSLDSEITNLQTQISSQNSTITSLTNIINLSDSKTWVPTITVQQGYGSFTTWTESANYSGYVSVYVQTSSVSGTHVEVIYSASAYGVSFDQTQVISAGTTANFPILPCSDITVGVGNGNTILGGSAEETVSITYYY